MAKYKRKEDMDFSSPSPEEILAFSENYAKRMYVSRRWQKVDREDFAQELAIKLIRAAVRYDPNKKVPWGAYANIVARGALLDWYRKINNHEELSLNSFGEDDSDYLNDKWESLFSTEDFVDLTPSEIIEWSKQFPEQRQKVIICLAMGYNRTETARILGVSQSRVTRLIRAIQTQLISQPAN